MAMQQFNRVWMTGATYEEEYESPLKAATSGATAKAGYLGITGSIPCASFLVKKDDSNWAIWPFCSFEYSMDRKVTQISGTSTETSAGTLADGDTVEIMQVDSVTAKNIIAHGGNTVNQTSGSTINLYTDAGKTFVCSSSSACTFYVGSSTDAQVRMSCDFVVTGSGTVTVTPSGGTLNGSASSIVIARYTKKTLMCISSGSWVLV